LKFDEDLTKLMEKCYLPVSPVENVQWCPTVGAFNYKHEKEIEK